MNKILNVTISAAVVAAGLASVFAPQAFAVVNTCTWTGAGVDAKFSTVANWTNCNGAAPVAGDIASFDLSAIPNNAANYKVLEVINDSNPALSSLNVTSSSGGSLILSQLTLGSGGSVDTQGGYVSIGTITDGDPNNFTGGDINVKGDFDTLSIDSIPFDFYGRLIVDGALTISSHDAYSMYSLENITANSISLKGSLVLPTDITSNIPIAFYDGASISVPSYGVGTYNTELTGPLTFNNVSPIPVFVGSGVTLKITGQGVDAKQFTKLNTSSGALQVGSVQIATVAKTTSIEGSLSTGPDSFISVGNLETAIFQKDSVRSNLSVKAGGVVKGVGLITKSLHIAEGGTIAPGLSPGCLTSDTLTLAGAYQFEIGGAEPCAGYDQLIVKDASNIAGAVTLDASTSVLATSLINDYKPTQGQKFVIINQEGGQAVVGTFKGLSEGATFNQGGVVYKISYVGGDGNDVTLTVMNQPTVPNTGFGVIKANPVVTAVVTAVAALALVVLGRKLQTARK